ncbi:MAG: hypothetical protein M1819_005371 [Sarea resinae]|nr:MAG: hypothetical protein M1819_005371 [Sarea resinae]
MAAPSSSLCIAGRDASSDYGSDFTPDEETALNDLLSHLPPELDPEEQSFVLGDIEDDEEPMLAQVPRVLGKERRDGAHSKDPHLVQVQGPLSSVEMAGHGNATDVRREGGPDDIFSAAEVSGARQEAADARSLSPLERFRTAPKKAFSVTDIVSPSWCELQYWYTLTKHGRKRRTPAMRQGSAVHKVLEDQVHETVAIDVQTKEDAWGLRIWNVIQGLRTLRQTGMTRELEIWGTVDGMVVNGIIDELSYQCPDQPLEKEVEPYIKSAPNDCDTPITDPNQATMINFLTSHRAMDAEHLTSETTQTRSQTRSKIYLTDVKTRGTKTLPAKASFRPTMLQLMLYHRLLSNLATNRVDANTLWHRYQLNASEKFSDAFIAQVGSLNGACNDTTIETASHTNDPSGDPMDVLLANNSLAQLWDLMIKEFQNTMPAGTNSIGKVLEAEYRNQSNGSILGTKTFLYDDDLLQRYLEDEMKWWKGEREARGVVIEEAYKCRICEFADECSWRVAKIEEATRNHRARSSRKKT